jgi:hypothetical protein
MVSSGQQVHKAPPSGCINQYMKYLNRPDKGWIGPQISLRILCRNVDDSSLIFRREGLVISFPFAHVVQTKSLGLGKLLALWPT